MCESTLIFSMMKQSNLKNRSRTGAETLYDSVTEASATGIPLRDLEQIAIVSVTPHLSSLF